MIPKWKSNLAALLRFSSTTSISLSCVENLAQTGSRLQNILVSKSKHFFSDCFRKLIEPSMHVLWS